MAAILSAGAGLRYRGCHRFRARDALSFTRLQHMIELTPGNLITHLRKLEDAGYLVTEKNGNGPASRTSVALTHHGRAALDTYTAALRGLLDGL